MIEIDGKTVDLTNPSTWGDSIKIQPGGFVEVLKDGVVTRTTPADAVAKTPDNEGI